MDSLVRIEPGTSLRGRVSVPGDKSLSHRSVMLSAVSSRAVTVRNFLAAEDCLSTVDCMRKLGIQVDFLDETTLRIHGKGLFGLSEPDDVLDVGNSGTTIRLLSGLLVGQPFFTIMSGDASLRRRPMARIVTPLRKMGGRITGRENSRYAPLAVEPAERLRGVEYIMPVASAQVKSALMLAALYADSPTTIEEPLASRDHTERMLSLFGADVKVDGLRVTVNPVSELKAPESIGVPGDFSSAAFLMVAATVIPGSHLEITGVGINPTRTGLLDVLLEMGADIKVNNRRDFGREPVADIEVRSAKLKGVSVGAELIPRLIDEIPVLSVAALFAEGQTVIRGAEELRVKETDRLRAMACELERMGAIITEKSDGMVIDGGACLQYAECQSYADHRVAMALAVAGFAAKGVAVDDTACIDISFPGFFETVKGCLA